MACLSVQYLIIWDYTNNHIRVNFVENFSIDHYVFFSVVEIFEIIYLSNLLQYN